MSRLTFASLLRSCVKGVPATVATSGAGCTVKVGSVDPHVVPAMEVPKE